MPKTAPSTIRPGRPRSEAAESHAAIMDAVYELLQRMSVRDLTMEAVANRAKVGKPTLYKWWPSKAALVMAMFQERFAGRAKVAEAGSAEQALRNSVRALIHESNGLFGKVMAELIAEGQSEPAVLNELQEQHMSHRRAAAIAEIERAKANGEFRPDTDAEVLIDSIIGPVYFRLLLKFAPLSEKYGDDLVDQVLRGIRSKPDERSF
jgi:AcrR family transcriptional regulator